MDGISEAADAESVARLLREADVSRSDMIDACKFDDRRYARNVLAKSPWYQLLVICWRDGQSSPIHDHGASVCGVRIVDGIATETVYQKGDDGRVRAVSRQDYAEGEVCMTSGRNVHVITNCQANRDLVTLHLYTPPLEMSYFEQAE
jgi:cysteine dioxygenase